MFKVITIDGPASSGKSTIGFLFAQRIGFRFIDTGAIYRAGCLIILRRNLDIDDEEQNSQIFKDLKLTFVPGEDKNKTILDGEDITFEISSDTVTKIVPIVAAQAKVREAVKLFQYNLAKESNLVVAGRDIGTEIFPDSPLKFFITCDLKVRSERRLKQLQKRGLDLTYEQVVEELNQRDEVDSTRQNSPFRKPADAIEIDTTALSIDESVEMLLKYFNDLTK